MDVADALLLAAIFSLLLVLEIAQIILEPIESLLPEAPVMLDPIGNVLKRTRGETARTPLRLAAARDQTCALQHLQMLRDCRKTHLKRFRQFRYRGLARGESSQYRSPGRVGEGGEGAAELVGRHALAGVWLVGVLMNHLVK